MTIKDGITDAMEELASKEGVVFLGENIINSGRIYGTLNKVSLEKCMEMPVAENLIAGVAIGLALQGYRPVVVFQRMDFMLIAADAIINHASLIPKMSGGSIKLPIIFRTIKATLEDKFYVGLQHSKDLSYVFSSWIRVMHIGKKETTVSSNAKQVYKEAWECNEPVLIVEDYKSFGEEVQ